jgi:hypothetical protein
MVLQLRQLSEEVLEAREMCSREEQQVAALSGLEAGQEHGVALEGEGWEGTGAGGSRVAWEGFVASAERLHRGCEAVYGRLLLLVADALRVQVG